MFLSSYTLSTKSARRKSWSYNNITEIGNSIVRHVVFVVFRIGCEATVLSLATDRNQHQTAFEVMAGRYPIICRSVLGLMAVCLIPRMPTDASRPSNPREIMVHIINLDKDVERWNSVTAALAVKGIPRRQIKRISGVVGKDLSFEEIRANSTFVASRFCTAGTIGCYLSHRKFLHDTLFVFARFSAGCGRRCNCCRQLSR